MHPAIACDSRGTHLLRGEERASFGESITTTAFADVPGTALETDPGDLIIFNIHAWHGSNGGGANRRIINLDYFQNPQTQTGRDSLCALGAIHSLC